MCMYQLLVNMPHGRGLSWGRFRETLLLQLLLLTHSVIVHTQTSDPDGYLMNPCPSNSVKGGKIYWKNSFPYYDCHCLPGWHAYKTEQFTDNLGEFTTALGCARCPEGTFTNNLNTQAMCLQCQPPNEVSLARDSCKCGAGFYSDQHTLLCAPCEAGKFNTYTSATSCQACPPGVQSHLSGTTCLVSPGEWFDGTWVLPCEEGWKCVGDGSRVKCSGEGEWSNRGAAVCEFCGQGAYLQRVGIQDNYAIYECTTCPPGHACASLEKKPCMWGKYQPLPGASTCLVCTEAEWAGYSETGHTNCDECPPGHRVISINSTGWFGCDTNCPSLNMGCRECEPGHFCPYYGSNDQFPCHAGQYQPLEGQMSCEDCGSSWNNLFTPADNMPHVECLKCSPGNYIPSFPPAQCLVCPAGMACDGTGWKTVCDSGTYSPAPGQSSCTTCPPGHVSPNTAASVGQTACSACVAGKVAADDQTFCMDCFPKIECLDGTLVKACNNGTFSTDPASGCKPCKAGTYTPEMPPSDFVLPMQALAEQGFQACLPCPAQGYYSLEGASVCLPCPPGYTCYGGVRSAVS